MCGYTLVGRVAERDDYCVLFFFVRHAYVYERAVGFASCADGRVEMLEVQGLRRTMKDCLLVEGKWFLKERFFFSRFDGCT